MHEAHINRAFLDDVVAGQLVDTYHHLGLTSDDPLIDAFSDLRAVVMAGSGDRIVDLADEWSARHGAARIVALPKTDRFVVRYCAGVLFASHGMGMPSAAVALQELMKLAYVVKAGDEAALAGVFWARVGTCGGVGVPPGTVIVSTEAVLPDLRPYRLLPGTPDEVTCDGTFPAAVAHGLVAAGTAAGIPIEPGRTVSTSEFFLEQFRLDGAVRLATDSAKQKWLLVLRAAGVRNIEMEGAVFAGYLNLWGFPAFAMLCVSLLDRFAGDQVTATGEQLRDVGRRAGDVLFTYLTSTST